MKIRLSVLILSFLLLLSSCSRSNENSSSDTGTTSSDKQAVTSAAVSEYKEKQYPEYEEEVKSYNLSDFIDKKINIKFPYYIGDNKIAAQYQGDKSYYCSVDLNTGEKSNKLNFSIPYGNGFAYLSDECNGIKGRYELSLYDSLNNFIKTTVPDARQIFALRISPLPGEFPLSERYTIRKTEYRIYLRDEKANTTEVIFENTNDEQYEVIAEIDETHFIFKTYSEKNGAKIGIYDVLNKAAVYKDIYSSKLKGGSFGVIDNKFITYWGYDLKSGSAIYYTDVSNNSFGETKELFTKDADSIIINAVISSDLKTIAIGTYKQASNDFNVTLIDLHSLKKVFTKTINIPKGYFVSDSKNNIVYCDDGTISIFVIGYDNESNIEYMMYIINTKK